MSDKIRQSFEAWARERGYYISRQGDGYLTETQYAWEGYEAARKEAEGLVNILTRIGSVQLARWYERGSEEGGYYASFDDGNYMIKQALNNYNKGKDNEVS